MVQGFSKPPPSATRPPLRVLKPLENNGFPVNGQNAVDAVDAANIGSRRYKKANITFTSRSLAELAGVAAVVLWSVLNIIAATAAASLLTYAPRCEPYPPHQTYLEPKAEQCGRRR